MPPRAELWLLEAIAGDSIDALDTCLASGMLRREDRAVAFRHELARLAVEDSINPHRRAELHRAALSALDALCEQYWPPVLTDGRPRAEAGVDPHALGTKDLPDGTQQVTYRGRPLYLSVNDAVIPPLPYNGAAEGINGAGATTIWGTFDTIPAIH